MADQDHSQPVRHLLDRVRSRWSLLALWGAIRRAALGATVPIIGLLIVSQWTSRAPGTLAVVGVLSALVAAGAVCWGLWPARRVPRRGCAAAPGRRVVLRAPRCPRVHRCDRIGPLSFAGDSRRGAWKRPTAGGSHPRRECATDW